MKRDLQRPSIHHALLLLVAVFALFAAPVRPAYAVDKAVVYDGTQKAWHGEGLEEQDVFMRFENVMPGDALGHDTSVRIDRPTAPVSIFVRLECSEEDAEKLDEVNFLLLADGDEVARGSLEEITEAAVKVGTFSNPDSIKLMLQIEVPTSLGNEHQFIEYPLNWRFIAQEDGGEGPGGGDRPTDPDKPGDPDEPVDPDKPTDPDRPDVPDNPIDPDKPGGNEPGDDLSGPSTGGSDLLPQTGESWMLVYGPFAFGGLGILAAAAGIIVLMKRRKKGE